MLDPNLHRLLRRQIANAQFDKADLEKFKDFFTVVNEAYKNFDDDVKHIEVILEESSNELYKLNQALKSEVDNVENELNTIVNTIEGVIFKTDMEGNFKYLNKAWEELLMELLCSTKYPHYCFHHPEENIDRAASGMAILARYPIRNVATTKFYSENDTLLSGSVFPALTASIEGTPLGNLEVANVHLRPPLELDGSATFSTARTTGPIREAEVKELLKWHEL